MKTCNVILLGIIFCIFVTQGFIEAQKGNVYVLRNSESPGVSILERIDTMITPSGERRDTYVRVSRPAGRFPEDYKEVKETQIQYINRVLGKYRLISLSTAVMGGSFLYRTIRNKFSDDSKSNSAQVQAPENKEPSPVDGNNQNNTMQGKNGWSNKAAAWFSDPSNLAACTTIMIDIGAICSAVYEIYEDKRNEWYVYEPEQVVPQHDMPSPQEEK